MKKTIFNLMNVLAMSLLVFASCNKTDDIAPSIASIAVSNPAFSELEDAAIRGGVAGVLSNPNANDPQGKFTVFAPTNDAFARLGLNTAADLNALNKTFLTSTLLYHVSNGATAGANLTAGGTLSSLLSPTKRFIKRGNDLYVNGSKILATDVPASNGTVHAIDKVILASGADIVQTALALNKSQVFARPELTFLVEAVLYTELAGALSASAGSPSFTVFAPTDQAFKDLGKILGVALDVPADIRKLPKETVKTVLLNHVINNGGKFTSEIAENTTVQSLGGTPITYGAFNNGILTVKGKNNATAANMAIPDVQCTNGVVHVIDRVLLP